MATGIKRDAIENYYGIATFAVETLTEHYSIGEIMDAVNNRELTGTFKALLSSFKNEGLEEVAANWGERIFNTLYEADKSELLQGIKDAQEEGKSTSQALIEMFKGAIGEDVESFIAGGFSGMLMGGVSIAGERMANNAGEIIDSSRIGDKLDTHSLSRSALDNDGGMRLIEAALELPEGSTARKVAEKYSNSDKKVSKHDAAVMMREVNRNLRKQISAQTESAAKQAIASELSERYGITDSDMTETAYRALTGQELSPDERALYEQSEQIREIVQDMQSDPNGKFARFFTETTTDAAISAAEQAMQTRETIAGVESGSTKALGSIVRPYIGKGNQKVVRGTKITAVNADGTFEMSTVDHKGADAGTVTISTSDLSSRVRGIYDAVIESTDNADIANAIIQAAATDRSVVAQISPELVTTVSDITRSGLSLSDGGIAMFAGVNTAAWERAGDTLKQAIYNATQKGSSDAGAVYSSVTREDVVRAYAASGKLGSKHAANAMLRLIERTAERYGVQTVFADLANGYKGGHIAGTNRIVLGMDIDAGLLTRTMGHEMFHYLTELNGALAGQLQSDVITWLKDTGKYDAVYAQFEENYSEETAHLSEAKKRTYLEEEIAADSCFDALSNDRFLGEFYVQTAQKKNGTEFLQKLADFFRELSQMLRDAVAEFARRYSGNELVSALTADQKMLEHINEQFSKLLATAQTQQNEKNAADSQREETIRFSRMNEKSFEENVDEILSMSDEQAKKNASEANFVRIMEHTPSVILDNVEDAADNEIIILFHSLYLETRSNGALPGNYHNLGSDIVKNLPRYLSDPDAIVRMRNGRLNLFTTVQEAKRNNRIVSVELNSVKDINSKNKKYNVVVTIFPARSNYVNNDLLKNGIKVEYEKEGLAQVNPQLRVSLATVNAKPSTDSISDSGQNVNTSDEENSGNARYQKSADSARAEQYSYQALVNKPDMQVTRISEQNIPEPSKLARKGIVNHAIENAAKIGKRREDGSVSVHVNDTDSDVILSRKGLEHGLDRRFSVNAPVTLQAGKILQNAIRINEMIPSKETAVGSSILIGMARNAKNEPYIVRFVINEFSSQVEDVEVLYALNAKKEPGALLPPVTKNSAPDTDSTISISDLLDFVNRYFPDILPESVLRHYGHTVRPDGVLGGSALFQKSADSAWEEQYAQMTERQRKQSETRETIAGVESGSTKALGSIVRPYIGKGNQKVVRGTKITAVNADGTFEMSTVDHKGADAGTVTISTSDLSSRVRGIYDAVIESTDNADIANAIIQAAAADRSVAAQISPELVTTVSDITRSGLSLSDGGITMFAGVNTAAWERAGDTLKQAIYNATQKSSSDAGAVYSSVTREDVVRAYAVSDKLGTKHAANAMLRLIERTAERYGVQTVFADLADGYKGGHIAGTNRIVLGMDIDAGLLTRTMGHEMFHYLKELNGALAGQLQSDVITWLKDTGKYDAVYAQFEENYSDETAHLSEAKKRTYLEEEIAADSCFDALSNDKFLASFCTETMKKKGGESFIKKLAEFFSSLSQMLRDTVANFRQRYKSNELVKALSEDADMLEHINEKFRELLESAKSAENKKNADTAQGDVRYSKNTDNKEILQIKKQIIASQDTLNAMNPVAHITSQGRNGRSNAKLQNDIAEKLKTKGYVVDVKGFGKIQIDEKRVKLALEYCTTDAEIAVFDTIHNVLKKNNVIGKHADHKNRSYETVTFAAPVVINGKRGNVGVVVRNTKGWLYKAHRILMPDGTAFNLDVSSKNEKSEMPTNGGNSKAEQRPFIISDSDNSISDSGQDVNTSDKENSGNVRYQMSAEKYSYDELVSKPDIKITTVEEKAIHKLYKTDRKAVINRALQNAKKVGGVNDHGAAFVHVNDINTDVIITSKSISHGLYRKYNTLGVVSENIGSILQNSIRINELKSRTDNIDSSYVLIGIATNEDGYPYIIRSIVNKYSNELSSVDVLYAINAKKESAALLAPRVTGNPLSITDSFISISDLLDFVNRYFPDILPESVLRHYGHTARPDGMLGGSALFQKSADSVREAEIRRLRQDYELTKLQNDLIRSKLKVWEHKVPSPKALRRYMNDVMQRYGVQYDDAGKLQAFEKLTEIYGYLVRSKAPNMVIVQDMAFDLARDMIANSAELEKTPYDSVEREFRRTLRETGVQITEAQKREIINAYGTMTNFRRESGGMIRINSKSKLFVADIIEEARSIYDIKTDHEDEFLVELLPYMKASADAAKGVWVDPYNGDAQIEHMAAMDLAATLLDALYDPNIVPGGYTYDKRRKKEFCRS